MHYACSPPSSHCTNAPNKWNCQNHRGWIAQNIAFIQMVWRLCGHLQTHLICFIQSRMSTSAPPYYYNHTAIGKRKCRKMLPHSIYILSPFHSFACPLNGGLNSRIIHHLCDRILFLSNLRALMINFIKNRIAHHKVIYNCCFLLLVQPSAKSKYLSASYSMHTFASMSDERIQLRSIEMQPSKW